MSVEVERRVEKHSIEIETIKTMLVQSSVELKESIRATTGLTAQLAVYIEKHEHSKAQMQEVKDDLKEASEKITQNTLAISGMLPTVNAVRNIMWKMSGAVLLGGGGIAAIIVAVFKTVAE